SIDYAFEARDLGSSQRLGISRALGASVQERREAARVAEQRTLSAQVDREFERRLTEQLEGFLTQARSAQADGRLEDGLEAITAARALAPSDPRVNPLESSMLCAQAVLLERAGDMAGAMMAYGHASDLVPGDTLATHGRLRMQAELTRRAGRSAHAVE